MTYPTLISSGAAGRGVRKTSHQTLTMALLAAALGVGGLLLPGLGTAQAQTGPDPYRWCADFGGRGGGGTSCYYTSFAQCQRELLGRGGICRPNPFYTGARRTTDGYGPRRYRERSRY